MQPTHLPGLHGEIGKKPNHHNVPKGAMGRPPNCGPGGVPGRESPFFKTSTLLYFCF